MNKRGQEVQVSADERQEFSKQAILGDWEARLQMSPEDKEILGKILAGAEVVELTPEELKLKNEYYPDPVEVNKEAKQRGERPVFGRHIAMPAESAAGGIRLQGDYDVIYLSDSGEKMVVDREMAMKALQDSQSDEYQEPFGFYRQALNCLGGEVNTDDRHTDQEVGDTLLKFSKISRQQLEEKERA